MHSTSPQSTFLPGRRSSPPYQPSSRYAVFWSLQSFRREFFFRHLWLCSDIDNVQLDQGTWSNICLWIASVATFQAKPNAASGNWFRNLWTKLGVRADSLTKYLDSWIHTLGMDFSIGECDPNLEHSTIPALKNLHYLIFLAHFRPNTLWRGWLLVTCNQTRLPTTAQNQIKWPWNS